MHRYICFIESIKAMSTIHIYYQSKRSISLAPFYLLDFSWLWLHQLMDGIDGQRVSGHCFMSDEIGVESARRGVPIPILIPYAGVYTYYILYKH